MDKDKDYESSRIMELESRKLATEDNREFVIKTQKEVERDNDFLATKINDKLQSFNIKSFDVVGAIGAGKTELIVKLCQEFSKNKKVLVICGDITTRIDADRIEGPNIKSIQINTGRECALNAYHIERIIKNIEIQTYDYVFIENVGNLICPSEFMLGMDKRITVVSTTEGEWVIEKHPLLFKMSHIAVINKIDLAERLETDLDKLLTDAKKINPNIKVVLTSAKTGDGIKELMNALEIKTEEL
ncbi:MAG: hydrogenase nickel incorporation protein HypB [Candidatus Lokiarchaeota archaeon]|nr:hydrogenase nickel incorporation protein HypB [Candidatus Lokiarchaeota archaeon]MBD3201636.1 hydrogenase nickel incorporation protein HypB [Candidatus Lokiarchaeota archaeon]